LGRGSLDYSQIAAELEAQGIPQEESTKEQGKNPRSDIVKQLKNATKKP